jgi:hypothetical protein
MRRILQNCAHVRLDFNRLLDSLSPFPQLKCLNSPPHLTRSPSLPAGSRATRPMAKRTTTTLPRAHPSGSSRSHSTRGPLTLLKVGIFRPRPTHSPSAPRNLLPPHLQHQTASSARSRPPLRAQDLPLRHLRPSILRFSRSQTRSPRSILAYQAHACSSPPP